NGPVRGRGDRDRPSGRGPSRQPRFGLYAAPPPAAALIVSTSSSGEGAEAAPPRSTSGDTRRSLCGVGGFALLRGGGRSLCPAGRLRSPGAAVSVGISGRIPGQRVHRPPRIRNAAPGVFHSF